MYSGSALGRLVIRRSGWALRCSANPRQHRLVIFVAVAAEELLMGAERRDPSPDFFAHVVGTSRRGRANNRDGLRGPRKLYRLVQRNKFRSIFSVRPLGRDGLHKRHGLRDQKIAFHFPFHHAPWPRLTFQRKAGVQSRSPANSSPTSEAVRDALSHIGGRIHSPPPMGGGLGKPSPSAAYLKFLHHKRRIGSRNVK